MEKRVSDTGRENCKYTYELNLNHIIELIEKRRQEGLSFDDIVIAVINIEDINGNQVVKELIPGFDWKQIYTHGQMSFVREIFDKALMQEVIETFDQLAVEKLKVFAGVPVIIIDHNVAEIFPIPK